MVRRSSTGCRTSPPACDGQPGPELHTLRVQKNRQLSLFSAEIIELIAAAAALMFEWRPSGTRPPGRPLMNAPPEPPLSFLVVFRTILPQRVAPVYFHACACVFGGCWDAHTHTHTLVQLTAFYSVHAPAACAPCRDTGAQVHSCDRESSLNSKDGQNSCEKQEDQRFL